MAGVWSLQMAEVTVEGEAAGLQKSGLERHVGDVHSCNQNETAAAAPRTKNAEKRNAPRLYRDDDARLRSQSQCFSTARTKPGTSSSHSAGGEDGMPERSRHG